MIPEQDMISMLPQLTDEEFMISMLRQLTDEEFQMLATKQEKILKDHYAKQVPAIGKLFPSLGKSRKGSGKVAAGDAESFGLQDQEPAHGVVARLEDKVRW